MSILIKWGKWKSLSLKKRIGMLKIIFWYDYFQIDLHKDKFLRVKVPIELFPVLGSNTYLSHTFPQAGTILIL